MSEHGTRQWRILSMFGKKPYWMERIAMQVLGRSYEPLKSMMMGRHDAVCELRLVSAFMREHVRKGVMFDVGAQYGQSFVPFAACGWQVLAFEPDPDPDKLRAMSSRRTSRVKLFDTALSNKKEQVPFFASPVSSGVSTLNPFLDSHEVVATVETDTVANVVAQEKIEHIDFLKIDTEGHDLFVLQGVDWETTKPSIVLCEFDDLKTKPLGYAYEDAGKLLLDQGYTVHVFEWYPMTGYGEPVRFRSHTTFPCDLHDKDGWGNMVAVQPALADSFADFLQKQNLQSQTQSDSA